MRYRKVLGVAALVVAPWLLGCAGHSERTLPMRTALDAGDAKGAVRVLNRELDVANSQDLPENIHGDRALLVLDRGSIQQGLAEFPLSKRDFEAADKAIDMLDLAHNAGDSIGEYIFSGSSGKYRAPPYEKLMINTLNMLNYLETRDLNGARVEARRLSVIQNYYRDSLSQQDNPVLGLGSLLAGFVFEKSGSPDEALRYYDEALAFTGFGTLEDAVQRLARQGSYRSPRITSIVSNGEKKAPQDNDTGDVLLVVGYGRVPHKIPQRIPIGLALTMFSGALSPNNVSAANRLAAQGLVTWINFPSLAPGKGNHEIPWCRIDGSDVQLEEAVNVDREVRAEWKKIEGKIIVSAITRLIARTALGQGIHMAGGNSIVGVLASLGTQATLTALDTPDTRSWETLPARVAVARMRVPAGKHRAVIDARGWQRSQEFVVEKNGWVVISLMALQ